MSLKAAERRLLALIQENGRSPLVELAPAAGMSETSCHRHIKSLERRGVIEGYAALVNRRALGLSVTAFVMVAVEKQSDAAAGFHERVRAEPHIVECHATSGSHDYWMKVVARDMDHFAELVMRDILKYPGVTHVESSFSLDEIKHARTLPV